MLTAYFFLEQFRTELFTELQIKTSEINHDSEGLVVIDASEPKKSSVWAQQIFSQAKIFEFQSIGEAAKQLLAFGKGPWLDASVSHHRRAALIGEKLRCRPMQPLDFLDAKALKPKMSYCLLEQNCLMASTQIFPFFPQGVMQFNETKEAPSRAYLKLWELFTVHDFHPAKGELCLDMGSSPGGWTWVLSQLGCRVLSVDKAPLAETLTKSRLVTSIKKDAFTLDPKNLIKEYGVPDWFFSDIICEPSRLLQLIRSWRSEGIKNFVCTVKFKGQTDLQTLEKLLQIPCSSAHHLFHNKHEVTWVLRQ